MRITALALAVAIGCPGDAIAQLSSGATVLFLPPSARTEALGRNSTAVFWGEFPDMWSNPALLGYHDGLRYEWGRTQLLPDFTDDWSFTSNRLTLGGWGVAVSLSGVPIPGAGGMLLDYGELRLTDEQGNVLGTYNSYEEVNSWGVGVNGVEFVESILHDDKSYPLSRYFDLSFGFSRKDVHVDFSPATAYSPAARDDIVTHDYGFAARLTPYNSIDHQGSLPAADEAIGLRLDLSGGWAWVNDESETIQVAINSDPVVQVDNRGLAIRGAIGIPKQILSDLETGRRGWLGDALSPLLSLGFNWDDSQESYVDETGSETDGTRFPSHGWELTLLNVLSVRRGEYYTWSGPPEARSNVERDTSGWGLSFDVPGVGGIHYDRARVELASSDLSDHEPTAFGFWVDPVGLWRVFK
jgi:hypothetical protein